MREVTRFPVRLHCVLFAPVVFCASCADLQLRKYRDDSLVQRHRYVLGEQYVDVNGLRLCYQQAGDPSHRTVLIIPGLGTSVDFWQLTIPVLAREYHVVAVDPPGFGKSDKPDVSYDLQWIRDQLVAFMDRMQLERVTLMGGSLGGQLALMIAIAHPERVEGMILMGSCGAWPRTGLLVDVAIRLFWKDFTVIEHMRRNWPEIFWRIAGRKSPVTEELFRYQMAVRASLPIYREEGRAASRALRSIFYTYTRPCIPNVRQPTLLIWGEDDWIHLLSEGFYFREHLPRARMVVVPDTAHEVMLDRPQVFTDLVLRFLRHGLEAVADDYVWALPRNARRRSVETAQACETQTRPSGVP